MPNEPPPTRPPGYVESNPSLSTQEAYQQAMARRGPSQVWSPIISSDTTSSRADLLAAAQARRETYSAGVAQVTVQQPFFAIGAEPPAQQVVSKPVQVTQLGAETPPLKPSTETLTPVPEETPFEKSMKSREKSILTTVKQIPGVQQASDILDLAAKRSKEMGAAIEQSGATSMLRPFLPFTSTKYGGEVTAGGLESPKQLVKQATTVTAFATESTQNPQGALNYAVTQAQKPENIATGVVVVAATVLPELKVAAPLKIPAQAALVAIFAPPLITNPEETISKTGATVTLAGGVVSAIKGGLSFIPKPISGTVDVQVEVEKVNPQPQLNERVARVKNNQGIISDEVTQQAGQQVSGTIKSRSVIGGNVKVGKGEFAGFVGEKPGELSPAFEGGVVSKSKLKGISVVESRVVEQKPIDVFGFGEGEVRTPAKEPMVKAPKKLPEPGLIDIPVPPEPAYSPGFKQISDVTAGYKPETSRSVGVTTEQFMQAGKKIGGNKEAAIFLPETASKTISISERAGKMSDSASELIEVASKSINEKTSTLFEMRNKAPKVRRIGGQTYSFDINYVVEVIQKGGGERKVLEAEPTLPNEPPTLSASRLPKYGELDIKRGSQAKKTPLTFSESGGQVMVQQELPPEMKSLMKNSIGTKGARQIATGVTGTMETTFEPERFGGGMKGPEGIKNVPVPPNVKDITNFGTNLGSAGGIKQAQAGRQGQEQKGKQEQPPQPKPPEPGQPEINIEIQRPKDIVTTNTLQLYHHGGGEPGPAQPGQPTPPEIQFGTEPAMPKGMGGIMGPSVGFEPGGKGRKMKRVRGNLKDLLSIIRKR